MKVSGTYLAGPGGLMGGFLDGLDRERNPWEAIFPIVPNVVRGEMETRKELGFLFRPMGYLQ